MTARGYFVTGTDTGVGKTVITAGLIHAFASAGRRAVGMKPVAAGCDDAGRNEDVERLRAAANVAVPEALMNPYCFTPPVAPHIAAAESGVAIDCAAIVGAYSQLAARADVVVVEGVGGFRVPLGPGIDTADLARSLGLPVILVVGMRLGCLNHALLTAEAILARGLPFAGWIANHIDPGMAVAEANVAALDERLPGPRLARVAFQRTSDPGHVAAALDVRLLP